MNRKDTTKMLTDILISDKLSDRKYYAKEVTLDFGTNHSKRVDVMQFSPKGAIYPSDMEKGIFTCYEIKSCKEDVYSGNGLNFFGEKNYIITTMETYKKLTDDINSGRLSNYISEHYPESSHHYGFLIPIPISISLFDTEGIYNEFMNPSPFIGDCSNWQLWTALPCLEGRRSRSTIELLFCMLRSKHNYTNGGMIWND